jgi:hypothetical protein
MTVDSDDIVVTFDKPKRKGRKRCSGGSSGEADFPSYRSRPAAFNNQKENTKFFFFFSQCRIQFD